MPATTQRALQCSPRHCGASAAHERRCAASPFADPFRLSRICSQPASQPRAGALHFGESAGDLYFMIPWESQVAGVLYGVGRAFGVQAALLGSDTGPWEYTVRINETERESISFSALFETLTAFEVESSIICIARSARSVRNFYGALCASSPREITSHA